MAEIWTMGELLCEIMRPEANMPLGKPGVFLGPYPSGAPAIFADTAARLGHTAGIIGCVGDDAFGHSLLRRLERDGVDCAQVRVDGSGSTGVAFVTYDGDGNRHFIFHFAETPAVRAKAPEGNVYGDVRCFHVMGCSLMADEGFAGEILSVLRTMAASGVQISFDPNIRPELLRGKALPPAVEEVMRHASLLFPGKAELLALTGAKKLDEALEICFARPNLRIIAVKNGSEGSLVCTREQKIVLGTYPVKARDATGAGDCFDAAFLCGLLEGKTLAEAARRGSAAAALNTASFGPMEGDISPQSVEKLMAAHPLPERYL